MQTVRIMQQPGLLPATTKIHVTVMQCSCEEMHVCMMGFPDMRFQVEASCFSQVKSHRSLSHCFVFLQQHVKI